MPFKKKTPEPINDAPVEVEPTATSAPDYPQPSTDITEVWDRRLTNPNQRGSTEIRLRLPGMVTRWINTTVEGRYHRAIYDQGWQPVEKKLLSDPDNIPDLFAHPHGIVCRGERGKEVLMMMPAKVFEKIAARKAELNNESLKRMRQDVKEAAQSRVGESDTVKVLDPTISYSRETVEVAE